MARQTGEAAIVVAPFLALIALSIYTAVSAAFAVYPFALDRALKRKLIRRLLLSNIAIPGTCAAVLCLYLVWGPPGYHVSSDPAHYFWMLLGVGGAHALLVQTLGAAIARLVDQKTLASLGLVAGTLGDSLYGPDRNRALARFRASVEDHEEVLEDYRLLEIARYLADPTLDYQLHDVSTYLLERLEATRSGLTTVQSPFRELNFVFSVTGASALVGIALAVAR